MKKKASVLSVSSCVVLCLYSLLTLAMLLWALIFSLTDYTKEIFFSQTGSYLVMPKTLYFQNYTDAIKLYSCEVEYGLGTKLLTYLDLMGNSLIFAVGRSFFGALAPCIMGYAVSQFRFKLNGFLDGFVIVAMILPIVGALPSQIELMNSLNLMDSFSGMFIMSFGFLNMYYLIFKGTFGGMSRGYSEAALIDGASNLTIFLKIMLPLARTVFFTIFILNFVSNWNSYTTVMVFAPNKPTIAYVFYIKTRVNTHAGDETTRMASAMVLMIPILIFYVFSNKFIMGNLTVGGLKG